MKAWLCASLITVGLWGFWGFFLKLASRSLSTKNLILIGIIGALIMYPIYFIIFHKDFSFKFSDPNYIYGLVGGIMGSMAMLAFYYAIHTGEASKVVTITALYPVITIILAFIFLKETITIHKIIGIIFAISAIYFLSK